MQKVGWGITTRASIVEGRAAPIQIQAQVLRQRENSAPPGAMLGFAVMPDEIVHSSRSDTPAKAHWRQSDVKRAIAAAEKAGLRFYRVEIAPDGMISIVVGAPSETERPATGL